MDLRLGKEKVTGTEMKENIRLDKVIKVKIIHLKTKIRQDQSWKWNHMNNSQCI